MLYGNATSQVHLRGVLIQLIRLICLEDRFSSKQISFCERFCSFHQTFFDKYQSYQNCSISSFIKKRDFSKFLNLDYKLRLISKGMKNKKMQRCKTEGTPTFVSTSNSKVCSYRSSDVLSNMITTNLLKSKKCICLRTQRSEDEKNAYDLAEDFEKDDAFMRKENTPESNRYSIDKRMKNNMKELILLETKVMQKANRIMNKREKTYVRNMEQGETQEELLKELKRYEEKDSAQSKLKQRDVLNKLMDKVSQNNQEKLVQKINFSGLSVLGDTSNDSEISFDEQVNNRSIQVQNMEKKFKKEIYIKNFDEVFKTERKKLTLKAFKQVNRYQARNNKNMLKTIQKPEQIRKVRKKERRQVQVRMMTEMSDYFPDNSAPSLRRQALQNYHDKFLCYINNYVLNDKSQ